MTVSSQCSPDGSIVRWFLSLVRDAAGYKRPLLSDTVSVVVSVRNTACAVQTTSTLQCKACSVASHVAYRLSYCARTYMLRLKWLTVAGDLVMCRLDELS